MKIPARFVYGLLTGTIGAVATAAVIALHGQRQTRSPWTPFNATAHMIYGNASVEKEGFQVPETPLGLGIHALSLGGWGVLYEAFAANQKLPASCTAATVATGLIYLLDYHILPERLRPGFEKRLGNAAVRDAYLALAMVFALAPLWHSLKSEEAP